MSSFGRAGMGGMTISPHSSRSSGEVPSRILFGIDQVLSQLGDGVEQALLYHVRRCSRVDWEDLPRNPEKFGRALAEILGEGAQVVEGMIVQELSTPGHPTDEHEEYAKAMTRATEVELRSQNVLRR